MIPLDLARAAAERYRLAWLEAKAKSDALKHRAALDHSSLPDNYWKEEHRARVLYHSSLQLIEALSE